MENWLQESIIWVLAWLSVPNNSLTSLFIIAFVSATLLPMGSEPVLFLVVKNTPDIFWWAIVVATVGNTLGGLVNYFLGWGAHHMFAKDKPPYYLAWLQRYGAKTLLLSFLPIVGDPLCALAGWLRFPLWRSIAYMAIGKFLRYIAMTGFLLLIPNDFWQRLFIWL